MKDLGEYKNLIFGTRAVMEAIHAGKEIEVVFVQQEARAPLLTELRKLLKEKAIPSKQVPKPLFNRYRNENHQGVVASISAVQYTKLDWLLPQLYEKGQVPFFLILDKVTDVRNFGAICRSASCFGVHAVIIPAKGSALINEFAVKSSAGALNHLDVCRVHSLMNTMEYLKDSGVSIIAISEKGEKNYSELVYDKPLALVMGAEDLGISKTLLGASDEVVKIPMQGPIESLNVSVAAGIVLSQAHQSRSREA
ncbi:MAG: 23S rRNA (guanosine(2251)-2'-O)-methyltransferase RlmB [Vicingaceae bacterium]